MIAFLFPGQGSQHAGMLAGVARLDGGSAVVDVACATLAHDLRADDTAAGYRSTVVAQRALLVAGVASARALQRAGVVPDAVAGHSVGTYAAAVVADAIDLPTALRLVDLRARLMAAASTPNAAMGTVGGLSEREVAAIAASVGSASAPLYATNVNAPDQIALAGDRDALLAALDRARRAGARSTRVLDVAVASHTPLMRGVADELAAVWETVEMRAPAIAYATNIDGRITRDVARLRADLALGVAHPVRWAEGTRAIYERGVRLFVEMLPGSVLCDLAAQAFADARAVALANAGAASIVALASALRAPRAGS